MKSKMEPVVSQDVKEIMMHFLNGIINGVKEEKDLTDLTKSWIILNNT